jgi:hypothetical protein
MAYVVLSSYKEKLKCPAEERENCEKSPLTNARKNCGKTDTRTSKLILFPNSLTETRRHKAHKGRRMLGESFVGSVSAYLRYDVSL